MAPARERLLAAGGTVFSYRFKVHVGQEYHRGVTGCGLVSPRHFSVSGLDQKTGPHERTNRVYVSSSPIEPRSFLLSSFTRRQLAPRLTRGSDQLLRRCCTHTISCVSDRDRSDFFFFFFFVLSLGDSVPLVN